MSNRSLELPQAKVTFSQNFFHEMLVFVAGGREPDKEWLLELAKINWPIWAIDRGLSYCLKAGINPELYIGDHDSISEEELLRAKNAMVEIITFPPMKDLTDLQLSLKEASKRYKNAAILLTGCWGGRFDHLYSILYSTIWAYDWNIATIAMADDKEIMYLMKGESSIRLDCKKKPKNISLLALSDHCLGVNIDNVVWPLEDYTLYQKQPFAISNFLLTTSEPNMSVNVSVKKGWLGVYLNF